MKFLLLFIFLLSFSSQAFVQKCTVMYISHAKTNSEYKNWINNGIDKVFLKRYLKSIEDDKEIYENQELQLSMFLTDYWKDDFLLKIKMNINHNDPVSLQKKYIKKYFKNSIEKDISEYCSLSTAYLKR